MPTKKREIANVEMKEMKFLYREGGDVVFMDRSNHEQLAVSRQMIGDAADLMTENMPCTIAFFNERPVDVTLPTFVQLVVTEIGPALAGNKTAKATVETGAVIDVPLSIRVGDNITIDTRTHEYVERVDRLDN